MKIKLFYRPIINSHTEKMYLNPCAPSDWPVFTHTFSHSTWAACCLLLGLCFSGAATSFLGTHRSPDMLPLFTQDFATEFRSPHFLAPARMTQRCCLHHYWSALEDCFLLNSALSLNLVFLSPLPKFLKCRHLVSWSRK